MSYVKIGTIPNDRHDCDVPEFFTVDVDKLNAQLTSTMRAVIAGDLSQGRVYTDAVQDAEVVLDIELCVAASGAFWLRGTVYDDIPCETRAMTIGYFRDELERGAVEFKML